MTRVLQSKVWGGAVWVLLLLTLLAVLPAEDTSADDQPALQGIDVSHHSDAVDWQAVKNAGYVFAYIKATEGEDATDSRFVEHWQATAAIDLPRGAYHFYVTEDDPNLQADFFIATVPAEDLGDLIPVVDVEVLGHGTETGWADNLKVFLDRLESHFGVKPLIYTSPHFWDANVGHSFGEYPLWLAEYGVDSPSLPEGWNEWFIWQFEGDQNIVGVESGADVNTLPTGQSLDAIRLSKSGHAPAEP